MTPKPSFTRINSMIELTAGLIDVFANEPLSGNPLAVVEGADALSDEQMRRVAGEFNQAETTFILQSTRADRKLRSFTASGAEVVGAGHNALGAWLWLAEQGELGAMHVPRTFQQEIGDVVLPITLAIVNGRICGRMLQAPLTLLPKLSNTIALADALGLAAEEILNSPPVRPADTGVTHLLVRVRDHASVDGATPVASALLKVLRTTDAEGCYIYSYDPALPETAYARFFNPTVGLWEDAATGTAAGPLAAYLAHEGIIKNGVLAIEQGTKMGRRSILNIELTPDAELSGSGIILMRGTLVL
jgi:PhzF family phenazine biosynthesis protein